MIKEKHARKHLKQGVNLFCNINKALMEFNRAINLNPNLAEAYYNRSFLYSEIDDKMKDLNKAIELNPNYVEAYEMRGLLKDCFYENPRLALVDFDTAISLEPKDSNLYISRAKILKRLELYDDAIIDYKKAIFLKIKKVSVWVDLGICYYLIKDFKSATKCFKRTIYKSKNNQAIGKAYKYLGYTSIEKEEDISNAVNYFKKSIKFYEKTPFSQEAPYGDLEFIYNNINDEKKKS